MQIEIVHYTKDIKGTNILKDINLKLESGYIYGLKGKNGSGKTMLMRAISGLILPTSGYVSIDGEVLGKNISFPRSIGVLLENPAFLPNYTGFKNLKILAEIKNTITEEDIRKALENVGLDPNDKRKYKKYSLGMKQKLGIACAIMESPDIIILDEPFNALDESGVLSIKKSIIEHKNRGAIIIIACHDYEDLKMMSDKIFEISGGVIIGGEVHEDKI